ncbi:hypothetical protein FACS1894206_04150 [Deltaproteobacteria bacterium]|nr:hypothetical protein FACS1894206_04150 [Deltaproteobacteria bacterium]
MGLLFVYFWGIAAILRANCLYYDDLARAMRGFTGWSEASRPLADFLANAFYLGAFTYDASPLTQLVAIFFLALCSLLLLKALRIKPAWLPVLCTVPVGLSPYILQCLSYKFDSPYMAAALLFALLPLAFPPLRAKTFTAAAGFSLYCSVALYHAALGAYLCLLVYFCVRDLVSRKKLILVWRRFFKLSLPFILSIGLFVVITRFCSLISYTQQHAALPLLADLPNTFAANVQIYFTMLFTDWNKSGLGLLMGLFSLEYLGRLYLRWRRSRRQGRQHAPAGLRLALLIPLIPCFFLSPYGLQFLLEKPVWDPRMLQSFGVLLALLLLNSLGRNGGALLNKAAATARCLLIAQLLVFANIYGNLLARQEQWESTLLFPLSLDLRAMMRDTGISAIRYVGGMGYTPLLQMPSVKFPLLRRLVPRPDWVFSEVRNLGVIVREVEDNPPDESLLTTYLQRPGYRIDKTPDGIVVVTLMPVP